MSAHAFSAQPSAQGLYDPTFEHDACGVAFVARLSGEAAHDIVEQGLESVITIRGTVKVRELLPEFDLFVLPSYNEGLPVVSLETMGAGIPTVSTDVGAVRSVVEDLIVTDEGETWDPCGIIIELGDPTVMADKVQEVISDVDLYERLSLNARGRVEAAYDLVKVNASYNKIYRMLGNMGEKRNFEYSDLRQPALEAPLAGAGE